MPDRAGAVRNAYASVGVEAYYGEAGSTYRNPHAEQIHELLLRNAGCIDYSAAFDFCCGSGEVSEAILAAGAPLPVASDPYTGAAYRSRCGADCHTYTFEEVVRQGLPGSYSSVVCSFAMHLCPDELLFPLAWRLLEAAPLLVVITPHKRPELEKFEGITLLFTDYALTARGKQVRLKAYALG